MAGKWDNFWDDARATAETLKALDVERARADGIAEGRALAARELNALTNENVRLAAEVVRLAVEVRELRREANGQ